MTRGYGARRELARSAASSPGPEDRIASEYEPSSATHAIVALLYLSFLVFGVDPFFLVFCLCSSWAWTVSHSQPASWGGRVFRSFADALSAPSLTLLFLSFSVAGRSALGLVAAV